MSAPYFEDGLVTIYHGDARDVLPTLPDAELVVADPPYAFGSQRPEWRITASVAISLSIAARKVKPKGALAVMTAASGRGIEYAMGAVEGALPFNRLLIWHKTFVNSPVAGPWRWDIVPILMFGKATFGRPEFSSCFTSGGHGDVPVDHPAALPVALGQWLLSPFDGLVLDPFMGSGSFLVAAKRIGRRAIGIDLDERHCETAASRVSQQVLDFEVPA